MALFEPESEQDQEQEQEQSTQFVEPVPTYAPVVEETAEAAEVEPVNEIERADSDRAQQQAIDDMMEQDELDTVTWGTPEDDEYLFGEDDDSEWSFNSKSEQDVDELIDGTPETERLIEGDPGVDNYLFGGIDDENILAPSKKTVKYTVTGGRGRSPRHTRRPPDSSVGLAEGFQL